MHERKNTLLQSCHSGMNNSSEGKNKRTKSLNELLILGYVGNIILEQVDKMVKAPLVTHSEFYSKKKLKHEFISL